MQQLNTINNTFGACDNLEYFIGRIICSLGIPPLLKGYSYIQNAAMLILDDSSNLSRLNDQVYPKIASQFNTTSVRVERAIKHAIEISWSWEGQSSLKNYYDNNITMPTNSEFLAFINKQIKIEV